MNIRG